MFQQTLLFKRKYKNLSLKTIHTSEIKVAPNNFWNMKKSSFRLNYLKRGFLLEDKMVPHILGNLLRVENCSQK
jgi:hypothetical protein